MITAKEMAERYDININTLSVYCRKLGLRKWHGFIITPEDERAILDYREAHPPGRPVSTLLKVK